MTRLSTCVSATLAGLVALGAAACSSGDADGPITAKPATNPVQTPMPANAVEQVVEWPSAVDIDRAALAQLSPAAQKVAALAPVPALVVDDGPLLANAQLMAQPAWYALSTRADGVIVSLHATRVAHRYPHIPPLEGPTGKLVRDHDALVTQNEAIWSAAWTEGGVAYSLEVECASLPDARCESEQFVLGLAGRLVLVGGSGVSK